MSAGSSPAKRPPIPEGGRLAVRPGNRRLGGVSPRQLVSLVPSLTELVCSLGGREMLAGRTRFCTEPAGEVEAVPIVGGTKNPQIGRIIALAPDLVLANREENRREDIEALEANGLDVLLTDPNTVATAMAMIAEVGRQIGRGEQATALNGEIMAALAEPKAPPVRVFVAVWWQPLMGLGSASYGHDLLEQCGAVNVLAGRQRYPEVSLEEVAALKPDLILLPDEPFPFKQAHIAEFTAVAPARVIDGKLLWWYGARIPTAIRSLRAVVAEAGKG
ncbi:MAG: cobalamin-binding protein [Anaerolinea sp.]|nr:cobalamin-binding protein [Anaerolinea sp.]